MPGPEWRTDFGAGRANSVKALARDSGDLRSALTKLVPARCCHYPGQAKVLKTDSETCAVLLLLPGGDFLLWCSRPLGIDLERLRALFRDVVTEGRRQLLAVIGEELRVEPSTRDGNIGHTVIEQVSCGQFGVHMNQHAIRGLSLTRVASHCVAVVQMWVLVGIDLERAARIHVQTHPSCVVNASDHFQFAICNFQIIGRASELNANRDS